MTIKQRYFYFISTLTYKCLHDLAPSYLSSMFQFIENNTRSSSTKELIVPRPHTEIFKRSLAYAGPKIWNSLPIAIREVPNINIFKCLLKDHLLQEK